MREKENDGEVDSLTEDESLLLSKESRGLLSRFASEFSFIRGNFLIILIGWLVTDFTQEMAGTYYPLYVQALGGTVATVGFIGTISSIINAFVRFPGGYLADKYGRKRLITTLTFLAGFTYLFYAFAPNWQTILLGAIIQNLCWVYLPAFDAIVMDSLPSERRGMGYSIINLITRASTTPSPLIAGLLYISYGVVATVRLSYVFVFISFLIAGLLRLRLKETIKDAPHIERKELVRSFLGARVFIEGIKVWRKVPKTALALQIIFNLFSITNAMLNVIFVFYMINDLGITPFNLSILGTAIAISMIALAIPTGKLVDKIGRKTPILIGFLLILFTMPFLIWGDFNTLLIAVPIIGWININFSTAKSALFADLIPPEHRGKISGSRAFFDLIAISMGRILGGLIYDNISHQLPLFIFWASIVPLLISVLLFIKEPEKKEE